MHWSGLSAFAVFGVLGCSTMGWVTETRTLPRVHHPVAERPSLSPFYVHGDAGLGTPEGLAGGGFGVAPTTWLHLELGTGLSASGEQFAGMLGLSAPLSEAASIGISSGVSVGRETDSANFIDDAGAWQTVWDWVLWSNTEMTIRHRLGDENALRFHAGVAAHLANTTRHCATGSGDTACRNGQLDDLVPYVGLGYEHHF